MGTAAWLHSANPRDRGRRDARAHDGRRRVGGRPADIERRTRAWSSPAAWTSPHSTRSRAYCDTCQIFMTAVYETLIGLDPDNNTLVPRLADVVGEQPRADRVHVHARPHGHVRRRLAGHQRRRQVLVGAAEGLQGSSSYLAGSIETIETPDAADGQGHAERVQLGVPHGQRAVPRHRQQGRRRSQRCHARSDHRYGGHLVPVNSAGSGPFVLDVHRGQRAAPDPQRRLLGHAAGVPEVYPKEVAGRDASASSWSRARSTSACRSRRRRSASLGGDVNLEQVDCSTTCTWRSRPVPSAARS